ncbi:MAG: hypothetical protein R3E31_00715 [Chloroflexota bacterium]
MGRETPIHPLWQSLLAEWQVVAQTDAYTLYRLPAVAETAVPLAEFSSDEGKIALLEGVVAAETAVAPGAAFTLATRWRRRARLNLSSYLFMLSMRRGKLWRSGMAWAQSGKDGAKATACGRHTR